ncbi:hypothetical protein [Magnetospirillum sp. 15-1]|uniref:hypothetical protein n=1 Tax=Magnetospirillum sp. 15-1 TaxID=1979370 RepID=UPI001F5BA405|nr:hypothetical protein [Magnetospirillum sp. 15-1]
MEAPRLALAPFAASQAEGVYSEDDLRRAAPPFGSEARNGGSFWKPGVWPARCCRPAAGASVPIRTGAR